MTEHVVLAPEESSPKWLINHLPRILWQRRFYVIGAFLTLLIAAVVAAYSLPTQYHSTATLLVQSQDLPTSFVGSPTTGAVEQRLARIREQVLSRGDLIALIEQNDLYPEERRSQPISKVIERMRRSTWVAAQSGDIGQSNGNNSTISVTMGFEYPEPVKAQTVLQSFVTKFLRMDMENVEDQASLSVRFLRDQAAKLRGDISRIEQQITALKLRHGSAIAGVGTPMLIDSGSYSAQITALQNENRQLVAASRRAPQRDAQVAAAEAALAAARASYSDSHPDVILARERLEEMRRIASQNPTDDRTFVQEQINANNVAIETLMAQRRAQASAAMAGQASAPAILERATQLENQASTLRGQYQEVANNLLKAQNSARMASEQRAERLSLVEPPNIPDRPHSPDRLKLIAAGAAAGLALGLVLALLVELVTRPVRSPSQIEGLGLPLLGVVPVISRRSGPAGFNPFRRRERHIA